MSSKFEKVKGYFERGLWSIERVRNAVIHRWITTDEFQIITGVEYEGD